MASITFVVPGEPSPIGNRGAHQSPPTQKGTVKPSVIVAAPRREGAPTSV